MTWNPWKKCSELQAELEATRALCLAHVEHVELLKGHVEALEHLVTVLEERIRAAAELEAERRRVHVAARGLGAGLRVRAEALMADDDELEYPEARAAVLQAHPEYAAAAALLADGKCRNPHSPASRALLALAQVYAPHDPVGDAVNNVLSFKREA